MNYGIEVVNLGKYADPHLVVTLAQAAERAGWEGVFVWDHLGFVWNTPSSDPWITLAAIAAVTTSIKIGTGVSPLPRYRPHVLAQMLTTLDILSKGRVIFGVGLGGVPTEYSAFGEANDAKIHAAMVDEGLDILNRLWSGEEKVIHKGEHYIVDGVTLTPLPVQIPRIPIWVGGESLPALRRAARWDGWIIGGVSPDGKMLKTPEQLRTQIAMLHSHHQANAPFNIALTGYSHPSQHLVVEEFAAVGVTWWLESFHEGRGSMKDLLARIAVGPPR